MQPAVLIEGGDRFRERPPMRPRPDGQWVDVQYAANGRDGLWQNTAGVVEVPRGEDRIHVCHKHGRSISSPTAVVGDPRDDRIIIDEDAIDVDPLLLFEDHRHRDHGLPRDTDIRQHAGRNDSLRLRLRHAQCKRRRTLALDGHCVSRDLHPIDVTVALEVGHVFGECFHHCSQSARCRVSHRACAHAGHCPFAVDMKGVGPRAHNSSVDQ